MKSLILSITFLLSLNVNAEKKSCSNENVQNLLENSAILFGLMANHETLNIRMFISKDYDSLSNKKIKEDFFGRIKADQEKTNKAINEIDTIITSHPECDEKHLFTLKNANITDLINSKEGTK